MSDSSALVTAEPKMQCEICLKDLGLTLGSDFVPHTSSPAIDTFMLLVKQDLGKLKIATADSKLDFEAVRDLGQKRQIVIRQADKW